MATVTTNSFIDSSNVYYPAVLQGNDQVVTTREVLNGGQMYPLSVEATISVTTTEIIDSSYVYFPQLTWPIEVSPSLIDDFQVYSPLIDPVIPSLIDSFELYSPTISATISVDITGVIDGSEVLQPNLELGSASVSPTMIDGFNFYSVSVQPGTREVIPSMIASGEYFFPPRVLTSVISPVTFKLSSLREFGGNITGNNVAPRTRYYNIPESKTITQDDLVYVEARELFPNYIRARDAMFANTIYRGFYVRNDSTLGTVRGLQFWINGGDDITVENPSTPRTTFRENTKYLDYINSEYGLTSEQYERLNLGGKSKSSLLGQVELEVFVSPTNQLVEFDEEGASIGLNLARQRFVAANNPVKLPSLDPGEYVGIYLRLTTKFSPTLNIPEDYSFMHLKYTPETGGVRETYPGQVKGTISFLPSVVLKFTTNYDKILDVIDVNKERLYNRYPPFFLYYEDAE